MRESPGQGFADSVPVSSLLSPATQCVSATFRFSQRLSAKVALCFQLLADSFSLFALICALPSFVFNSLPTLLRKCRGGVGIPIRSLDFWGELTKASGGGDAHGIPGVAYPSQRFGSSVTALLNELTHMFSWRFVGATLSTFRINTGSVDILPDEGMPQAIEVVGKTEQQGLANLYR